MEERKCDCGNEVEYDGFEKIDIVEGYVEIRGYAYCNNCNKKYEYIDDYVIDFKNPYNVQLEDIKLD